MPHATEINDLTELAGCRLLWKSLLAKTPAATFFQSLDWLEPYWRHFGHHQTLRVLVIRAGDEPLGIVPLVIRSEKTKLGAARVLSYPLDHWGNFYGPIGSQPAATLIAALQHLRSRRRDWDLLSLRWVPRDGGDRGRTLRAMRFVGWTPLEEPGEQVPVIDLRGSWDDYWSTRDGHWRDNVARSQRRLAEQGEIESIRYRPAGIAYDDADPRWDLFEQCVQVARHSGQAGVGTGPSLSHDSILEYMRDAHRAAARAGGLDLNLLTVAGRPAAFAYNFHYHGHLFGLRMGYDPTVSRRGSGTVLLRQMVEDSFRRGDHTFDLSSAPLDCKRHWQTSVETRYRYTHFASGAPGVQALRWKRYVQRRWMDRFGSMCKRRGEAPSR